MCLLSKAQISGGIWGNIYAHLVPTGALSLYPHQMAGPSLYLSRQVANLPWKINFTFIVSVCQASLWTACTTGSIPYGALCKPIHHQFQEDNENTLINIQIYNTAIMLH